MKILVTGGLGFIGSHITEHLVKEGHDVTVLDNLHTGSEENIAAIKNKIKIIRGRAVEVKNIKECFDVIFHEGIYSSSPMYKENPYLIAEVIEDFIALLEYARAKGAKIVFSSTSSLYSGLNPPHREDMAIRVTDLYTEARLWMERLAELYHTLYGVRVIGLRYFSVYGPHEKSKGKYANLISQFLWAMRKGEAPVIYGDGSQTRDFVYVDDVVEANMLVAKSSVDFGIFNVGTGKATSINDMVMLLNKKLGTNIKPKYIENPVKNYVQHTLADTSKAEKILGFKAKVNLEEGIERLLKL